MRPRAPSHRRYVLRFGEQLSEVAQRYSTTEKALRNLNELGENDTVAAGLELLVPDMEPIVPPPAEPPVVAVPVRAALDPDRTQVFYRVTGRESLEEIAGFFQVSGGEIRQWNQLAPDASLPRGLFLQLQVPREVDLSRAVVFTPDQVRVYIAGSDEFLEYHEARRDRVRIRYRVQPGDTLSLLAERFDLSVGSLCRINGFSARTELRDDQEIIVYAPKTSTELSAEQPAEAPVLETATP
jgi:membrane-bound lytic murein transglycosylase D